MSGATMAKERLAFLDVTRGVAARAVVVEHALELCLPGYLQWSLANINMGRVGVIIFLLVSGFIIPLSLEQGGSNARFWLRRFFRLFPLYWLSIALGLGYAWLGGVSQLELTREHAGDWLLNTTMLQGFFNRPHVWGVFWTLQLELVIYGICSLLFATGLLGRTAVLAGLALIGCALIGVSRPLVEGKQYDINGLRFLYFAPLMGMVAQRYTSAQISRGTFLLIMAGLPAMVVTVWLVNFTVFPDRITVDVYYQLLCNWFPAFACFFVLMAMRDGAMPAAACWLGRVSYSVYLLHPLVLVLLLTASCPNWALLPALVCGTLLLSAVTYHFVEVPSISWGRALERRWLPMPQRRERAMESLRRAA